MRRATNNKRGFWAGIVLKGAPKWAGNMYYVEDEADRVGDDAILYDARYKTLIGFDYEEGINATIKLLQRRLKFFEALKVKEPWK